MIEPESPEPGPTRTVSTDAQQIPSVAYSELSKARRWSVRLIVSIPVLILLIVLASGSALYIYLEHLAETTTIPDSEQLNLEKAALNALLISIGISIIAGVIGFIVALQITRPIKQMITTIEAIASGDLQSKVQPINLGEFGQLGNSFNRMVEQLNMLFEERDKQLRQSFGGTHLVVNRDGAIAQADQAVKRILGISAHEIVGKNLLSPGAKLPILNRNPALLDALVDLYQDAITGRTSYRSVSIKNEEGVFAARYLVTALPLDSGGDVQAMQTLIMVRDISGFESFYEQMQRADRLAAVGTLATGIAHEIRNPLASIRGMLQLMDEMEDTANAHEYRRRMLREVDRLEKLVAGIMNFAQSEDSPSVDIDLNELVTEVVLTAKMNVGEEAEAISVKWELEESLPGAKLQSERLRQALLNLVVNAFQYCVEKKCGPIRIQTMHLPVNAKRPLIVCISNPAEQLSDELKERIFEPFYTTKPEGTGLGLPIAYQTVLANGGLLEIECEDGEVQFWVRLPLTYDPSRSASKIIPRMNTPLPEDRPLDS